MTTDNLYFAYMSGFYKEKKENCKLADIKIIPKILNVFNIFDFTKEEIIEV